MPSDSVKKPLLLSALKRCQVIDKAIIESLEQAFYRLVIEMDQQQYYVIEEPKKTLTRRSILDIQQLLIPYQVKAMYLSHTSPYDEMIGHAVSQQSNQLLIPIGNYFDSIDRTLH